MIAQCSSSTRRAFTSGIESRRACSIQLIRVRASSSISKIESSSRVLGDNKFSKFNLLPWFSANNIQVDFPDLVRVRTELLKSKSFHRSS